MQHKTVWKQLCGMTEEERFKLFLDAETLNNTGMLPLDAPLRRLTEECLERSNVMEMTMISFNIYRYFALAYMVK